jgi:hypothetical protein
LARRARLASCQPPVGRRCACTRAGIIHRDIKPWNTDRPLRRRCSSTGARARSTIPADAEDSGLPPHARLHTPEQARAQRPTPRSDVYCSAPRCCTC